MANVRRRGRRRAIFSGTRPTPPGRCRLEKGCEKWADGLATISGTFARAFAEKLTRATARKDQHVIEARVRLVRTPDPLLRYLEVEASAFLVVVAIAVIIIIAAVA